MVQADLGLWTAKDWQRLKLADRVRMMEGRQRRYVVKWRGGRWNAGVGSWGVGM